VRVKLVRFRVTGFSGETARFLSTAGGRAVHTTTHRDPHCAPALSSTRTERPKQVRCNGHPVLPHTHVRAVKRKYWALSLSAIVELENVTHVFPPYRSHRTLTKRMRGGPRSPPRPSAVTHVRALRVMAFGHFRRSAKTWRSNISQPPPLGTFSPTGLTAHSVLSPLCSPLSPPASLGSRSSVSPLSSISSISSPSSLFSLSSLSSLFPLLLPLPHSPSSSEQWTP